ncbi:hypothetical protein EV361DRAFT_966529 [Lentinula raphanica]|nr:hypothetical protein EV361DRAFT_966529 [Lentinula raphanica]
MAGAKKKPLPEGFDENPDDSSQMRCHLCFQLTPFKAASGWQKRGKSNAERHCNTATHQANITLQKKQEADQLQHQQNINASYAGSSNINSDDFAIPEPSTRPSLFSPAHESTTFIPSNPVPAFADIDIPAPYNPEAEKLDIRHQFEQILLRELFLNQEDPDEDASETNVVETLRSLGLDDDNMEDFEADESFFHPGANVDDHNYAPYPNKLMMLLDLMDNLPRLRMSNAHFKLILWIMSECGITNVPTYYAFRKMQGALQTALGDQPKPFVSALGNHFHVNDPREAVKRNFANPHVAKHLHFYPEESTGPVTEVWQCDRWKEYSPSEHTPMFSGGGKQFYIDEVATLNDSRLVMPVSWIVRDGILCADAHPVTINAQGEWVLRDMEQLTIPSDQFRYNYLDIVAGQDGTNGSRIPSMPNPIRKLVPDGYDLYDVYYPLWVDDVSGNKSKQYNKHINMYTVNSNLPGRLLQQEYFVQFVSTSPNASSSEQFSAVRDILNETHKAPILCYNATTGRMCGVRVRVPGLPADNPQQAEEACHAGGNSNYLCRKCNVGGPREVTESDDGYHALFTIGVARSAADIRASLDEQLRAAMTGVKSAVTDLQRACYEA